MTYELCLDVDIEQRYQYPISRSGVRMHLSRLSLRREQCYVDEAPLFQFERPAFRSCTPQPSNAPHRNCECRELHEIELSQQSHMFHYFWPALYMIQFNPVPSQKHERTYSCAPLSTIFGHMNGRLAHSTRHELNLNLIRYHLIHRFSWKHPPNPIT